MGCRMGEKQGWGLFSPTTTANFIIQAVRWWRRRLLAKCKILNGFRQLRKATFVCCVRRVINERRLINGSTCCDEIDPLIQTFHPSSENVKVNRRKGSAVQNTTNSSICIPFRLAATMRLTVWKGYNFRLLVLYFLYFLQVAIDILSHLEKFLLLISIYMYV